MENLDKQLNRLPKPKMSLAKKTGLKYKLYILIIQNSLSFNFLLNRRFQYRAVSFVVLLSLLLGLPFYSYASSGVNEKHILYPIKMVIEKIELKTADTNAEKQEKYEKFSERRLAEAEVISKKIGNKEDRVILVQTIQSAVEFKKMAQSTVDNSLEIGKNEIKKREASTLKQKEKLNKIASFVGIEEDEKLVENIAVAMDSIAGEYHKAEEKKNKTIKNASLDGKKQNAGKNGKRSEEDNLENIKKFAELKERVKDLRDDLKDDNYDEMDIKILFKRLDRRVESVAEEIENETPKNINKIINSTKSITNNAKHFMKKKK